MRKEGMYTGPRFGIAQFVIDAVILLLDGPHDLYVDFAQTAVTAEVSQQKVATV
jgi:hypothetical protein